MKIYVKTDGPVPDDHGRYITPGKVYEVDGTIYGGYVTFDDGSKGWIYIPESSHLDCEPWTLCDEHGNPVAETDWQLDYARRAGNAQEYRAAVFALAVAIGKVISAGDAIDGGVV
jgi:hypothetical protein